MRAVVVLLALLAACGESDPPRPDIDTAPYHDVCDPTMSCPEPYACVEGDAGHEDGTFCFVPCDADADCPAGFFCNGVDVNADVGAREHCAEDV